LATPFILFKLFVPVKQAIQGGFLRGEQKHTKSMCCERSRNNAV